MTAVLTPSERRGALAVVLLLTLGTCWDLWRAIHPERSVAGAGGVPAPFGSSAEADSGGTISRAASGDSRNPPTTQADPALVRPGGSRGKHPPARPVDINAADANALHQLPGIGPVLAARIVSYRQANGAFASVDELRAVRGIGPRLFERIRPFVRVAR